MQTFTAAAAGYYLFIVAGGQGGFLGYGADLVTLPGLGATVEATAFLQAGATVPIVVAGQGGQPLDPYSGGGGGGLSAVYTDSNNPLPTIVAGWAPSLIP